MAAKKKRWTEEAINNATKDVLEGNLSVRRAYQNIVPKMSNVFGSRSTVQISSGIVITRMVAITTGLHNYFL